MLVRAAKTVSRNNVTIGSTLYIIIANKKGLHMKREAGWGRQELIRRYARPVKRCIAGAAVLLVFASQAAAQVQFPVQVPTPKVGEMGKYRTVAFTREWLPCGTLQNSDQTVCTGAFKFPMHGGSSSRNSGWCRFNRCVSAHTSSITGAMHVHFQR